MGLEDPGGGRRMAGEGIGEGVIIGECAGEGVGEVV